MRRWSGCKQPLNQKPSPARFPWAACFRCRDRAVVPATIPYAVKVNHDGVSRVIEIPRLEVPRCQSCGELVFDNAADEQINAALRSELRLLTPAEIHAGRERLGLTPNAALPTGSAFPRRRSPIAKRARRSNRERWTICCESTSLCRKCARC